MSNIQNSKEGTKSIRRIPYVMGEAALNQTAYNQSTEINGSAMNNIPLRHIDSNPAPRVITLKDNT